MTCLVDFLFQVAKGVTFVVSMPRARIVSFPAELLERVTLLLSLKDRWVSTVDMGDTGRLVFLLQFP